MWALRPPGAIILGGNSSWGKIGGKYEIERKRKKERDEGNTGLKERGKERDEGNTTVTTLRLGAHYSA